MRATGVRKWRSAIILCFMGFASFDGLHSRLIVSAQDTPSPSPISSTEAPVLASEAPISSAPSTVSPTTSSPITSAPSLPARGRHQPRNIITLEGHPSRQSAGIISLPDGSPWCKGNATIWIAGHQNTNVDTPYCYDGNSWSRRPDIAAMDLLDFLNSKDDPYVIDFLSSQNP